MPSDWNQLWGTSEREKFTGANREKYEKELARILHIEFIKKTEELNQQYVFSNLTSFSQTGVTINMNFSDPLLISAGEYADQVRIKMLKSYFFQPKEGPYRRALAKNEIDEEYFTFDVDIPRQMVNEEEMVALESSIESSVDFL